MDFDIQSQRCVTVPLHQAPHLTHVQLFKKKKKKKNHVLDRFASILTGLPAAVPLDLTHIYCIGFRWKIMMDPLSPIMASIHTADYYRVSMYPRQIFLVYFFK